MAPVGFFIDANLLVLLVVGSVGRNLIAKHRRLREYSEEDYEVLVDLLTPWKSQPAIDLHERPC